MKNPPPDNIQEMIQNDWTKKIAKLAEQVQATNCADNNNSCEPEENCIIITEYASSSRYAQWKARKEIDDDANNNTITYSGTR